MRHGPHAGRLPGRGGPEPHRPLRHRPRDQRTDKQYFDIIGNDYGIFGCMGLLACEDVCPKKLPLQNQLGFLRRKMGITALKQLFRK